MRLCGELFWVGCRPKCECVCVSVCWPQGRKTSSGVRHGSERPGCGGHSRTTPCPQYLGHTRTGPGHQLCSSPLGAGWAQGCHAAARAERTSEGQRPEAESPPQGWGRTQGHFLQLLPYSPSQPGTTEEARGKTGCLAVRELDTGCQATAALWPWLKELRPGHRSRPRAGFPGVGTMAQPCRFHPPRACPATL